MARCRVLVLLALAASGCEGDPHQASWTIRFAEPALRERAVSIEARIEQGGCGSGIDVYAATVVPGELAAMPPRLEPGVYGFAARARDESCTFFASGCTERRLPTDDAEIVVVLTRSADEPGCPPDGGTDAGRDGGMDGGPTDGGSRDGGPLDGGPLDGGPPDTGPADAGPDLTTGLVARWECEDDPSDGIDDVSGHGNDGRCTTECPGAVTRAGRPGLVCAFGAPRHLRASDVTGFRATRFTIAMWINPRSLDGAVLGKPVGTGASNSWQFEIQAPNIVFTTGIAPDSRLFLAASAPLRLDEWHHVAASYDGTRKRLYQDGVLVGTQDAPVEFDTHDVIVGADENGGMVVLHFNGYLDDIRVYERVLSPTEIEALAGM